MKLKRQTKFLGSIIIILLGAIAYLVMGHSVNKTELHKTCPTEWYEDRMPGQNADKRIRQYLIVDGNRAELKDYDMEWIESNCKVSKPTPVY